ncbi:hypothetical protein [Litorimonas sp.]|uniref:hypothetical protein n=1 Tax=Litorimonas sp. TaxID=1892381 RepID=UPI003A8B6B36
MALERPSAETMKLAADNFPPSSDAGIVDTFSVFGARDPQEALKERLQAEQKAEIAHNAGMQVGTALNEGIILDDAGARRTIQQTEQERQKRAKESVSLHETLESLRDYEKGLADKHGEHFAENLLSDLNQDGLIEDDDYKRIMSIEDQEQRRVAIAAAIQDGLDSGRIQPEDLKDHPWAQDWLRRHEEVAVKRELEAKAALEGDYEPDQVMESSKYASLTIESDSQENNADKIDKDVVVDGDKVQKVENTGFSFGGGSMNL